jgi:hypothetical protein
VSAAGFEPATSLFGQSGEGARDLTIQLVEMVLLLSGVAGEVQPLHGHTLAVMRGSHGMTSSTPVTLPGTESVIAEQKQNAIWTNDLAI